MRVVLSLSAAHLKARCFTILEACHVTKTKLHCAFSGPGNGLGTSLRSFVCAWIWARRGAAAVAAAAALRCSILAFTGGAGAARVTAVLMSSVHIWGRSGFKSWQRCCWLRTR